MIAFVDFTRDNGAASSWAVIAGLIVGCRRWEMQQPVTPQQLAYAEPAGSAVVYLGGTMHGGANTDVPRRGAHLSYAWDGCARRRTTTCRSRRHM